MMMLTLILRLTMLTQAAIIVQSSLSGWVNDWDKKLVFDVGSNHMLTGVSSYHSNKKEDRRWRFDYGTARGVTCRKEGWTSWKNSFDQYLNFACGSGTVLSGIQSVHQNRQEDRIWRFRCCRVSSNVRLGYSRLTSYLNDWDDSLDFRCGASEVLYGFRSYHHNGKEDRRWGARCIALLDRDPKVIGNPILYSRELNSYDRPVNHIDRSGRYVLSGLNSWHSNRKEDRIYKVYRSYLSSFTCANSRWTNYVNNYDAAFTYICPSNRAMNGMYSVHNNRKEDRRFKVSCCDMSDRGKYSITNVYTTGYVNEFDSTFKSLCGYMEVMVGLHSYHNNRKEDRRFQLYCGRVVPRDKGEIVVRTNAIWSDYLNGWDAKLEYVTSDNKFIVGFDSIHSNKKEDRRWKVATAILHGAVCSPGGWGSYANSYDAAMDFTCPPDHALAGVYSVHSNRKEDRVWRFQCCNLGQSGFYKLSSPLAQPGANHWDGRLYEECSQDSVLVGAVSVHNNGREDRLWHFYCSKVIRLKSYFKKISSLVVSSDCTVSAPEQIIQKSETSTQDNRYSSIGSTVTVGDTIELSFTNTVKKSESFCSSETLSRTQAFSWGVKLGIEHTTKYESGGIFGGASVEMTIKAEISHSGTITTSSSSTKEQCVSEDQTESKSVTLKDDRKLTTEVPAQKCVTITKSVRFFRAPVSCSNVREITATNFDDTPVEYDELLDIFRKTGITTTPWKHNQHALRFRETVQLDLASHTEAKFTTKDC